MTYLAPEGSRTRRTVFSVWVCLTACSKYFPSQASAQTPREVEGIVIGGHGDKTITLLARLAAIAKGQPVKLLERRNCRKLFSQRWFSCYIDWSVGNVSMVCSRSKWSYVESILHNQKKLIPALFCWKANMANRDLCIGAPVILAETVLRRLLNLILQPILSFRRRKSAAAVIQD